MLYTEGDLTWPSLPTDPPSGADPDLWGEALAISLEWLWAASGRQFGSREIVYRPQALQLSAGYFDTIPYLQSIYGPLFGEGWPFLGDPRGTGTIARQVLELLGPVTEVSEVVTVDGDGVVTTLDPSAYRLDGRFLIRVDGQTWPTSQNLVANDGDPNTWHVTYLRGNPVPVAGQVALGRLALSWLAVLQDPTCKVPFNATTVSRAGVTVNRDALKGAKTSGVEIVDRWVGMVNPQGLAQPPVVWSPDTPRNGAPYSGSLIPYQPTS